jgi:hypothetical protein
MLIVIAAFSIFAAIFVQPFLAPYRSTAGNFTQKTQSLKTKSIEPLNQTSTMQRDIDN